MRAGTRSATVRTPRAVARPRLDRSARALLGDVDHQLGLLAAKLLLELGELGLPLLEPLLADEDVRLVRGIDLVVLVVQHALGLVGLP